MTAFPTLSRQSWPKDPEELDSFYGNPRGVDGASPQWEAENLVTFTYPWHEQGAQSYRIHKKVLASLQRILQAIWDYAEHDPAKIAAAHLNETGGTYNFRANVNNPSQLSNHARGIAIDLAPDENPNRKAWVDDGTMLPRWAIEAFKAEGWRWGGDFFGTKDAMHFEAVFDQHHDAPPVPAPGTSPVPVVAPPTVPAATDLLSEMREFLLTRTGITDEVEAFKKDVLADLAALSAKVSRFTIGAAGPAPAVVPSPPAPKPVVLPVPVLAPQPKFAGITATVFGGPGDEQPVAYPDVPAGWPERPGVALPFHFKGARPQVIVFANGKIITCDIVDVGPWNTNDPYWTTGARPQAESGTDKTGRHTNGAGIDLTPAAASVIGIDGKGKVDWSFAQKESPMATQVTVPVASPLASKINWTSIVGIVASVLTFATGGKIGLTVDQQAAIVTVIGVVQSVATIAFRTFGTTTITPQSLPKGS